MERPKAKHAWSAIGLGVLAWELWAEDSELLSSAVDRALERSPASRVATIAGIGVTAFHLLNGFEALGLEDYDPFRRVHELSSRVRG